MIWQNPIAWAGLLALAVPVLIHMYSRRQARVQMFPSLRFLDASRLLPTRRTRVSDWPLLLVRLAVLATIVAALAQPLWNTTQRSSARAKAIARAIIVDTSASMQRIVAGDSGVNRALVDAATNEANRLSAEAATSSVVLTSSPARALAGAIAWLKLQSGRSEIVIVSDFQIGTLDSLDLQAVPGESGIRLVPVVAAAIDTGSSIESRLALSDADVRTKTSLFADRTVVEWSRVASQNVSQAADSQIAIGIRGSEREVQRVDVTLRSLAALALTARIDANRPVVIVFPEFAQRSEFLRNAKPLDSLWMVRAAMRVRNDATFAAASSSSIAATNAGDTTNTNTSLSLGLNHAGRSIASATRGDIGGRDGLIVFANTNAGDVASAALIAALSRALTSTTAVSELAPGVVSATQLRGWQREPSTVAASRKISDATTSESDARWLWVLALVLLGVESWMRRVSTSASAANTSSIAGASNVT